MNILINIVHCVYCKSVHHYGFHFNLLCKHCLLQQAPTYQILSLTFRPNFCIPSLPCLVQEVVCKLIEHVNINKKKVGYVHFSNGFISYCSCYFKCLYIWKEECFWMIYLSFDTKFTSRETFFSQCCWPR